MNLLIRKLLSACSARGSTPYLLGLTFAVAFFTISIVNEAEANTCSLDQIQSWTGVVDETACRSKIASTNTQCPPVQSSPSSWSSSSSAWTWNATRKYWTGSSCATLDGKASRFYGNPTCMANATASNGTCICNAGYNRVGDVCVAQCPAGQHEENGTCVSDEIPVGLTQKGTGGGNCEMLKGNPVNVGTGNKFQAETDYTSLGLFPLSFKRYYNSSVGVRSARLGPNWRNHYDRSIVATSDAAIVSMYRPDGKAFDFRQSGGVWTTDADIVERLEKTASGWRYTNANDEVETYDASGKLVSIASPSGSALTFAYDGAGRLQSVTDPSGSSLAFAYDANGRLASLTDPAGGMYAYAYGTDGNLASVTYPGGGTRQYLYNESAYTSGANLPNALTGLLDENGERFATWNYDSQGRAVSSEHGDGADKASINYVSNENGSGSSSVTDALGNARTINFQTILGVARSTGESQPGGSGCGPASSAITYDANGNVASRADFNGNQTCYAYDTARNLETMRVEGLAAGKACPASIAGYTPASGTAERVIITTWHASFRLPLSITEPGRATSYAYDTQGNLTQKSVRDTATNATRNWNWTYTYSGLVPGLVVQKIEDGPRTDVSDLTTTDYFDADATCDGGHNGCRGQVSQVTNALGHATRITRYNAHGQPEEIIDPNGLVTILAYDPRQRLVSRSTGSELTAYEYDPAGQFIRLTRPDGSSLNYEYDAAHRLVRIADSLGNAISYTLDAMGNRTREDVHDPANQLTQTRSREYDALNRLYRDLGAAGQATSYAYDAQGNLKQVTDPLVHSTGNSHDALNRLIQVNDPAGGQTRNIYDSLDRVVSVTDPKGVVTTYTYNGLGDLTKEVSADRGTTSYTYDSAGNLLTRTDARGVKHTYSYDALNRPTSRSHTTVKGVPATASLAWSYDTGTNGKGRLTGMSDETGSTAFSYDAHGRLLGKAQTAKVGTTNRTHTLGYGYDASGRLARQTYPSGAQVDLAYGIDGRPVEILVNGQVLISDIVYQPFGAPRAWTWGNGTPYVRQFDSDGRLDQYPLGNDTRTLGFDAAGRIVSLSHTNPAFNRSYDYDAADRLTNEVDNIGVSLWTYDLNSNRTSAQLGSSTYAYAYPGTSNRVTSVAGPVAKTYTYDAAGNITGDGLYTYTYNAGGRLAKVVRSGKTNTYQHNALGQRIIKSGAYLTNGPYAFLFDEAGYLVGEYDNSNALRQETVWLGDTPVAVLKKDTGGQLQTYAIHADHLDTPRVVVDGQGRMVWRWLSTAFGQNLPEEDPDGDGQTFEYNLRFPGQYYDKETGLHYNYFRDYDPSTGRYVQFDLIGLRGGLNGYTYVGGNPVSLVDPLGLLKIILLPKNDPNYPAALKAADDDTTCLVISHGSPQSVNLMNARQLNDLLKRRGCKPKQPVKLDACRTGQGENSIAEQLAKLRGGLVTAPDERTWTSKGGMSNPIPMPPVSDDPKSDWNDVPNILQPGSWRDFNGQGPISYPLLDFLNALGF